MRRCNRLLRSLSPLLAAAVLTGCAGIVPGTPESAAPDLGALDTGEWDTTRLSAPANGKDSYGRILESARLAEAVINPIDIDASLVYPVTALVPTPLASVGILAEVARPILTEFGMVAGYSVTAGDTDGERSTMNSKSTLIRVTVLSLHDPAAAAAAAQRIGAADFAAGTGNETVEIPGYEAAQGHWRPTVPTVGVYIAHGSFVVALYLRLPEPDSDALAELAAATLDAQLPKLDTFTPTRADQLATLPLDPDGMVARMVPMRAGQWTYPSISRRENYFREVTVAIGVRFNGAVVLGPGGVDHQLRVEQSDRTKPGEYGIDRLAETGLESLYRFTDARRARWYYRALVDNISKSVAESADAERALIAGPAGVPDAFCYRIEFNGTDPYHRCYLLDGRFMATVIGPDETFVRRRAAAQYALLAGAR
ncbi:hypothetical protein [Nocardia sp. NPDC051832]|uniref:DUF7373 family lipoprotein n=1 Tax=Nocardia sp. NPDC051832 TaxID=3155673 RepID=UPI003440D094